MKKNIILFVFLFWTIVGSFSQVGINTNNPKGIFYIDGGTDNATTSVNRFKNDVMVDNNGSLILGQSIEPTVGKAKVDIMSDTAYGALRLSDGGEAEGMVLLGDSEGYARWGMLKGSGGFKLGVTTPVNATGDGDLSPGNYYTVGFSNGLNYISIREAGNYIVMIRATFLHKGTPTRTAGTFSLYKNTINTSTRGIDSYEMYTYCFANKRFSVYTVLQANNLAVGDKLYWVVRPLTTGSIWMLNLQQTSVFFYRV